MPTLLQSEHATQEPLSPGKPLDEENPLDQTALGALREFFLILDSWDRAEARKLMADPVYSNPFDPKHKAMRDEVAGIYKSVGQMA